MRLTALIPARGGSKGLPRKNVRELGGKPLIAHTIEAALAAESVGRVVVTTDDEEIATVARAYGAEVPFMRPARLASDDAGAIDVYLHAMDFLARNGDFSENKFMVLLPTAPLRTSTDIDAAVALFESSGADTLVSMTEADVPPTWYYIERGDGTVANAGFGSTSPVANRQACERYLIPNGAIYILDIDLLRSERTYYSKSTVSYVMPRHRSIDIDTKLDFDIAELLYVSES